MADYVPTDSRKTARINSHPFYTPRGYNKLSESESIDGGRKFAAPDYLILILHVYGTGIKMGISISARYLKDNKLLKVGGNNWMSQLTGFI